MQKIRKRPLIFVICVAAIAFAATKPDFSGTYVVQQKRDSKSTAPSIVLRVVQSDSAVEVTRVYGDKSITNSFPLDGSEGVYTTEAGARGKCKAHLKNENSCAGISGSV